MDNDRPISVVKNELNALDKEKESYFAESKANRQRLNVIFSQVKTLKNERNALTDSVKKAKLERDTFNAQLKEKITAFKKIVPPQKKESAPKERVNVSFVKKEIEAMEYKIEHEGLPFNKEQELMKVIKEKRKSIAGQEVAHSPEVRALSKEIDEIRAKADAAHTTMRKQADESQKKHEQVVALLKEFKELQKKQKELDVKCKDMKEKVHSVNEEFKGKRTEVHEQQEKRQKEHHQRREDHRDKKEHGPKVNLEAMQHKAEEKLKKGLKLTTEDLLAFQQKK